MFIIFGTVLLVVTTCTGLPYTAFDPRNLITVPPSCPEGQQWVNGQCRDIWRHVTAAPSNIVTVPPSCPPGQQWINGQCRDIWRFIVEGPKNIATVPQNCPPGQQWINGQCRDIWFRGSNKQNNIDSPNALQIDNPEKNIETLISSNKNIINVPNQCPTGYKPDALGNCRPIMN